MEKSNFVKNIFSVLNYKIVIYFVSMLSSVYIARVLGPEGKGIFAIITNIIAMGVQFENMGVYSANTYYISKDIKNAEKCYGNAIILTTVCFIINTILVFAMRYVMPASDIQYGYVALAIFMIAINLLMLMQKNFMIALGAIKKYNFMEIFDNCGCFILVLIASLFISIDVNVIVVSLSLSNILLVILGCFLIHKSHIVPHFSIHYFKKFLPYGIKNYIAALMAYLALRIDVFMIKYFMGDYEVGLYSLAANMGELFFMVSSSISLLLFPHLCTMTDFKEKIKFFKKVYMRVFFLSIGLISLYFICAGFVVKLLYGIQYADAIPALRVILPGIFFWSVSQYFYSFFTSENHIGPTIFAPTIGCFINITLNLYLIPRYGIIGAAIATTISYAVCFIIMSVFFLCYLKKHWRCGNEKK